MISFGFNGNGGLNTKVENIETTLESARVKQYGVRRVLNATSPLLTRLGDAVGLVANADKSLTVKSAVVNNFDNIYPWSHMRKCIRTATGQLLYQGEPGYDVAVGDWLIEVPEMYIKHTRDEVNEDIYIAGYPLRDYVRYPKFYIGRCKTTEIDGVHYSRPSTFPKVVLGRTDFRTKALAKGSGWQLADIKARYVLTCLYKVEFANLDSQAVLGSGVTSVRYTEDDISQLEETGVNRIVLLNANAAYYNVGEAISIGTARGSMQGGQYRTILSKNNLGNGTTELVFDGAPINMLTTYKAYEAGQITGKTFSLLASSGSAIGVASRASISYRGIEDIFGNVHEWVDGDLINERAGYVCLDPTKYADTLTADFVPIGYTNGDTNGYAGEMGYSKLFPFAQFPINVTGGSTTKYCDYYYQATGLRAPFVGGSFGDGVNAGLFYWTLIVSPSAASVGVGARLLYRG